MVECLQKHFLYQKPIPYSNKIYVHKKYEIPVQVSF